MANPTIKHRVEVLTNGVTITNRITGDKAMSPNHAGFAELCRGFITDQITSGEPGDYFDVDIVITRRKNPKPKAA